MDQELTLADFEPILKALQKIKQPPHAWVGGQAIIVWANRFLSPEEILKSGLKVPLSSKDGDLKASEEVARFLAESLKGKIQTYRLKDPTRGLAWGLIVEVNGKQIVIDVLEKMPGVSPPSYIFEIKAGLPDKSLTAKVIDPLSLLLNKTDVWNREKDRPVVVEDGLIKNPRHDKEHLVLLGMVVPKYLTELERWQKSGTALKTTVEAERARLRDFLDSNPTLPEGVAENLAKAFSLPVSPENETDILAGVAAIPKEPSTPPVSRTPLQDAPLTEATQKAEKNENPPPKIEGEEKPKTGGH